MPQFNVKKRDDSELANPLRNDMYLPITIDEGVYLRGALKLAVRNMKQGDERDFTMRVLDRLQNMLLDLRSYQNLPF